MKHITVVAAVIQWRGKVLCMQRGHTQHHYTSHHWEFPGGKIEEGETPQQALHREILEEIQLEVEVGQHITTINHTYPDFHITLMFYRCTPTNVTGEWPQIVRLEHNDHLWLTPQEMPTLNWCPADLPLLPLLL